MLDIIVNFFGFLSNKIVKVVSGDNTPVFANMQEFKYGMFKPLPTSTARKVDKLDTDMTWYIQGIENEYKRATPYGWQQ